MTERDRYRRAGARTLIGVERGYAAPHDPPSGARRATPAIDPPVVLADDVYRDNLTTKTARRVNEGMSARREARIREQHEYFMTVWKDEHWQELAERRFVRSKFETVVAIVGLPDWAFTTIVAALIGLPFGWFAMWVLTWLG